MHYTQYVLRVVTRLWGRKNLKTQRNIFAWGKQKKGKLSELSMVRTNNIFASKRKRKIRKKNWFLHLHWTSSSRLAFCLILSVGCSITHKIRALWCALYTAGIFASLFAPPLPTLYESFSDSWNRNSNWIR